MPRAISTLAKPGSYCNISIKIENKGKDKGMKTMVVMQGIKTNIAIGT